MTRISNRAQRGSTLIVVLGGIVLASAVLLALVQSSGSSQLATSQFIDDQGVYYAAQGATDLALSAVWGAYKAKLATQPGLDFQTYLNYRFTWESIAPGQDPLADQMRIDGGVVKRATVGDWSNLKLGTRIISKFSIYQRARNEYYPGTTMVKQYNYDLMIAAESQKDLGYKTSAEQVASFGTATSSVAQKTEAASANWVAQYYTISNPPMYKGLEYGVLTKNVQCTLCHLHVSSAAKAFNKDPSKFNTFPRVKIGSTNFMGLSSGADTLVEGTIYQRGRLEDDGSANLLSPNNAASRLRSVTLNQDGTIKQNTSGNATTVVTTNTLCTGSGGVAVAPAINGNFYANYPSDTGLQTDGVLPSDDFPSPFPDLPRAEDNNRPNHKVDSDEVIMARQDAVSAADPTLPGTIQGGIALTLQPGTQYGETTLPSTGSPANISTGVNGNVILIGTASNPILLDGKVVIDGDVIIRGYVQGTGQIFASGNIYIPGDVIYKNRTDMITVPGSNSQVAQEGFGLDAQNKPNLLGLVAGKNIVVGDYLSQITTYREGAVNAGLQYANADFYSPRYVDASNNVVVKNGQPEPGRILTYDNDKYLNPSKVTVMSKTICAPDGKTYSAYSQPNFTMFQLAGFNQIEYVRTLSSLPDYGSSNTYDPTRADRYRVANTPTNNPNDPYDANYVPRFYSFYSYNANDPKQNPVYVTTTGTNQAPEAGSGGNGGAWNVAEKRFQLQRHSADPVSMTDLSDIPSSVQSPASLAKKNVINVHPDWITPDTMMRIISSEELTRQAGSRRVDGLLYTSNAMLAIERKLVQVYDTATGKWKNAISRGGGNLTINGAVVAPDMGVLTPYGVFNVNYDGRVASLLKVQSSTPTTSSGPSPANWDMVRKGFTKNTGPMPAVFREVLPTTTAGQ